MTAEPEFIYLIIYHSKPTDFRKDLRLLAAPRTKARTVGLLEKES